MDDARAFYLFIYPPWGGILPLFPLAFACRSSFQVYHPDCVLEELHFSYRMETISQTWESMVAPVARKVLSVTMDFNRQPHWDSFFYVWLSQFIMSWVGFSIYMYWDYQNYKKEQLEINKLPTRHPLEPFWYAQVRTIVLRSDNKLSVFIRGHWDL